MDSIIESAKAQEKGPKRANVADEELAQQIGRAHV